MTAVKTLIGNIKGPKGDTGEKGDTGATGPRGPQGEYAAVDSALSATSTNPVQNKVVQAALSNKLGTTGDTKNNIVSFTSADSTSPTAWTDVAVLASGEKHSSLFNKISTMFKNVRYLYKMLGTTDISGIGNGTVTGGLSALNSNFGSLVSRLSHVTYYSNSVPSEGITVACPNIMNTDNISVSIYIGNVILGNAIMDRNLFVNGLNIRAFWVDNITYYFDVTYIDNTHINIVGNSYAIDNNLRCLVLGV